MKTSVDNILNILRKEGEDFLKIFLASFSCPLNAEIEQFIREKAGLVAFYGKEGFQKFGERFSDEEHQKYLQLMRFL